MTDPVSVEVIAKPPPTRPKRIVSDSFEPDACVPRLDFTAYELLAADAVEQRMHL